MSQEPSSGLSPSHPAVVVGLFIALVGGTLVLSKPGEVEPGGPAADGAQEIQEGRALYGRYCALCHGTNAEGHAADHAPALGNDEFLRIATDSYLTRTILTGREGTPMSAFGDHAGGPLSHPDVGKIVAFLRSLQLSPTVRFDGRPLFGDIDKGLGLFAEHCRSCHSSNRQTATAPHLEHPAFQDLVTDRFLEHSIRFGRPGTPMEAWGNSLSNDEIVDLVAAIRSFDTRDGERGPRGRPSVRRPGGQNPGHEGHDHAHDHGNPNDGDRPNPLVALWEQVPRGELVLGAGNQAPTFSLTGRWYVSTPQLRSAVDAQQKMILLDARAMSDWLAGHIPGALPVPFYADADTIERIPDDDTWIVIYCGCPHAAADRVASRLQDRGIDNIAVLDEGYFDWRDNEHPVVTGPERGAIGGPERHFELDLPTP